MMAKMARVSACTRMLKGLAVVAMMTGGMVLGGCELAALAGKGEQDALYKFGKDQKVLVLVDVRDGVTPPPAFPTMLADKIGTHLFHYKATDHLLSQEPLIALQQRDPAKYKTMSVQDIARACGADVVLDVYITQLWMPTTTDGLVSEAEIETYVKVVDKNGARLYPGDPGGTQVSDKLDPAYISDRDTDAMLKEMVDTLGIRIGRMFHKYSLDDKDLTK